MIALCGKTRLQSLWYHASASVGPAFVKWLFERLGVARSVPFCLLASTIFAGFLSVLLSVLTALANV
jgi:hypothetical protein